MDKMISSQEQGFKVNISSIDFLTQIGVLTHNVWKMVKSPSLHTFILMHNNVLLYLYSKKLQIIHTFDNVRGVGMESIPSIQIR